MNIDFLGDLIISGIILNLIGGFYIIYGHLLGSGKEIFERCHGDYEGISEDLFIYLDRQRIEAVSGFTIIIIGFALQVTQVLLDKGIINNLEYQPWHILVIIILSATAPLEYFKTMKVKRDKNIKSYYGQIENTNKIELRRAASTYQKDYSPNGYLHIAESISGYIIALSLVWLSFWSIKNTNSSNFAIFTIILAVTLILFLIVFRKRPISFNIKIGLTSGIDIRWCLKKDEQMILSNGNEN